jgi:hypothetical protein
VVEECDVPADESTDLATVDDDLEQPLEPSAGRGTLKFVRQNLHAAWQKARSRDAGDSVHPDPPTPIESPSPLVSTTGLVSADLDAALSASAESGGVIELIPTDIWWAQRWIDKATPGEVAAMRELLS